MKQSETGKNITDLIKSYSLEFGIEPAFIEKDIYVVKVLDAIAKLDYSDLKIVFSGGTCLSKAYNKIQRFSEDIDFRIHTERDFTRSEKTKFYEFVLKKLHEIPDCIIVDDSYCKRDEGRFLSFDIKYKKLFEGAANLRPNIKVEFTFEKLLLEPNECEVKSFLTDYIDDLPVVKIACIQPQEVIANKLSALMWRVHIKDRTKPLHEKENDPTIMRHLHDIAALESETLSHKFIELLEHSFNNDKTRGGISEDVILVEFAQMTLEELRGDTIMRWDVDNGNERLWGDNAYKKEYSEFVDSMCYASSDETITFEKAIESLKNIIDFIKKTKK
jgi:predicted nucleotidyltransferase component of viral defense system